MTAACSCCRSRDDAVRLVSYGVAAGAFLTFFILQINAAVYASEHEVLSTSIVGVPTVRAPNALFCLSTFGREFEDRLPRPTCEFLHEFSVVQNCVVMPIAATDVTIDVRDDKAPCWQIHGALDFSSAGDGLRVKFPRSTLTPPNGYPAIFFILLAHSLSPTVLIDFAADDFGIGARRGQLAPMSPGQTTFLWFTQQMLPDGALQFSIDGSYVGVCDSSIYNCTSTTAILRTSWMAQRDLNRINVHSWQGALLLFSVEFSVF